MSDNVNEARHQVKRKYGAHAKIKVNENGAIVRDTIIKYVGKNYVREEDLHNHLIRLEEDRGGARVNKTKWFKRNQKFFTTFEKKNSTYYSLSKYGLRVLEMIKRGAPTKVVNESIYRNIPSLSEFSGVNETYEEILEAKEIENYKESDSPSYDYLDESLVNMELDEADWTEKIKTKWHPPAGLFTTPAANIAKVLKDASDGLQQSMARLTFYINRAGKNLDPKALKNLDQAKVILHKSYA